MGESMLLHRLPLRVVLLLYISVALFSIVTADIVQTTKPGCANRCGNLTLSYPFGMNNTGDDCYFEESNSFLIFCDDSTNPPTPYMFDKSSNITIVSISIEKHEISIMMFEAKDCYNSSGGSSYKNDPSIYLPIFPISPTKNKFIAVGCDTYAVFRGRCRSQYTTGCLSVCESMLDVINGSCSGIGCCEASLPRDANQYSISVTSYRNHVGIWEFNPCGYAFVAEDGFFNFSTGDLSNPPFGAVPIVVDWSIPNKKCDDANKNTTTYMCQENSNCTDAENGNGYQCNCLEGFQGNPYLQNDINECVISQPCIGLCTNLLGMYNCSCPKGSQGDGRKDGKGCTPIIHEKRLLSEHEGSIESARIFTDEELKKATDHYHESQILGQGGQGTVYLGILPNNMLTTLVQGTLGYLDPEYLQSGQLIEKSDVYSFGVVLAELLTGLRALSFKRAESERNLSLYFASAIKGERLFEIIDPRVLNEGNPEEIKEVVMLASRCLRVKGEDQPTMKEVAMELEGLMKSCDLEEAEQLLGERSSKCDGILKSNASGNDDSISNQVPFEIESGR
ncbi:hypothetical protein BT93_L1158 [Corymbia citriodora subsp. variegata]|uniref:EGF-like domain-containing protein n=1 Tax=Corymbia citriodora subsp. variegata TaxID=360336 RepID=A0A8T0CNH7_CORYI|nr:hypothetical protein BT93_L1158 [Corymbia citriodora subsp. variegata]